eukprot:TRINITY_DN5008_c0_g1_i1.p1 TRINITY_DN5008_c0_g1~~TRINITY_DN5008_c0_g1_i1.p1  ORF type:complete len:866 (-),score=173.61 TRINITY_DN5008_c0_g1_i1:42-2639(-)
MANTPTSTERQPLGTLSVEVFQGRKLLAMDRNGLSDPYVKIKHEGAPGGKWTSEVCPKTLNPRWIEGSCQINIFEQPCCVFVEVWDEDKYKKDDFIGRTVINLEGDDKGIEEEWCKLEARKEKPKEKEKERGEILMSYSIKWHTRNLANRKANEMQVPGKMGSKKCASKKQRPVNDIFGLMMGSSDPSTFINFLSKATSEQVNDSDNEGNYPLHIACLDYDRLGPLYLEQLLKFPNINVNVTNKSANTPLHYFCQEWKDPNSVERFLDLFCKQGAEVNAVNSAGETALFKATKNDIMRKVLLSNLMARGADPRKKTERGDIILHYAARTGRADLVRLILSYSTDVTAIGAQGLTPAELAVAMAKESLDEAAFEDTINALRQAEELFEFLDKNGLSELKQPLISKWKVLPKLLTEGVDDLTATVPLGQKLKLNEALKKYKTGATPGPTRRTLSQQLAAARGDDLRDDNYEMEDFMDWLQQKEETETEKFAFIPPEKLEYCDELGRGAFGAVWKCFLHTPNAKKNGKITVAVKVLFDMEGDELENFKQEFSILNAIRHKNVVRLIGVAVKPKLGMVMEFCGRGSLYHLLNDSQFVFTWDLFFSMALGAVSGIRRLHKNKPQILHRDLKSLNLLVTRNYEIKVADFGLAQLNTSLCSDALKQIQGTISYIAPEMVEGNKYTTKSDIFSLSIILWEMVYRIINLKHIQPYSDREESKGPSMVLMFLVANKGLRPELPHSCPDPLKSVLSQCWSTHPADRMDTAELKAALKSLSSQFLSDVDSWNNILPASVRTAIENDKPKTLNKSAKKSGSVKEHPDQITEDSESVEEEEVKQSSGRNRKKKSSKHSAELAASKKVAKSRSPAREEKK